ncbi:hypothetical protein [Cupriavidus pauculus]|uniref:hypothetical protein n=1 Tax=Cupriavidus pauculus TaxID=82633 RepID=UPI0038579B2F
MKLLLLAFVDLGIAPSRTSAQVKHFHKTLVLLATQCDSISSELTMDIGLGIADDDAMIDLLTKYQAHGAEGLWDFRSKWDSWIRNELEQESAAELLNWEAACSGPLEVLLRARDKGIKSLDPNTTPAVPNTVDTGLTKLAKLLLIRRGAFDAKGFIRPAFIAQALRTKTDRLIRSATFIYHLRQYELANDYCLNEFRKFGVRSSPIAGHRTLAERAVNNEGYLTQTVANGLLLVSRTASLVVPLAASPLARTADIEEALESFSHRSAARTMSIPLKCGLDLIRRATEWQSRYGEALASLLDQISHSIPNSSGELTKRLGVLAKGRIEVHEGSPLKDFLLTEFWGHAHRCEVATWSGSARRPGTGVDWIKSLSVCDLLELYTATAFVITTLFACCRKQEVSELVDSDLFERRGSWYLKCYLRKRGVDGVRKKIVKPIPNVVAHCLRTLSSLRCAVLRLTRNRLPYGEPRIFFRLTRSAVVNLQSAELYHMLDMFSEFHGLNIKADMLWHVRPHQLRRFFALTFFHYGGKENSLPALSWFMGHEGDIERTWRYIMEELRGEEISVAEASLAALAVYSEQESAAAETLRRLLLEHFHVESLDVMEEMEVENYLMYLHTQGKFSAKPICIRTARGVRYDVLVLIRSDENATSRKR